MLYAIATLTAAADGQIPGRLQDANYLLICDYEENRCLKIEDGADQAKRDVWFAQKTLEWDCECIICGPEIEKEAFNVLADHMISRFDGAGHTASQVRRLLYLDQLPNIRDHVGGSGCAGAAHPEGAESCEGKEH